MKLCLCGCGNYAPIAKRNNPRWGHVAGEPLPFIRDHAPKKRKQTPEERRARERRYYERNKEHQVSVKKLYRERRPDVYLRSAAKYRAAHPNEIAARRRAYRATRRGGLGIPVSQFDAMLEKQGGSCAVCARRGLSLVIDHDHENKKVRGLLCRRCNMIAQHPAVVRAVLAYMERSQ